MQSERKNFQVARTYQRNGVWGWSLEEQQKALEAVDGIWEPAHAYIDELPERRAKHPSRINPVWLEQREHLLAPTGRKSGEQIAVAAMTVLAPTETDLISVIRRAGERRATIHVVDSGFQMAAYQATIKDIEAAVQEWQKAKAAVRTKEGRTAGYIAAAAKKRETTRNKLKIARPLWFDTKPNRPSVLQIADQADLSPKTLYRELKSRPRVNRRRSA